MTDSQSFSLVVKQLTVTYDKNAAIWDINLSVPKGKCIGIIGPNGAGKSTFLKALMGLVKPVSGTVEFFGKTFKQQRKKIAYVPQKSSVDWDFPITVFDLALMGRYHRFGFLKRPRAADKEATWRVLETLGMRDYANRQISQLSGGQQQRIFLARALLQEADIYFFDEPFVGIDIATEKEIVAILDKLKKEGKTLFVVHHNLATVEKYFDWAIMLNTCLVASGSIQEVFTSENIIRLYGKNMMLLDEVAKLSQSTSLGMA